MASLRIWMSRAFITWIVLVATPSLCLAQAPALAGGRSWAGSGVRRNEHGVGGAVGVLPLRAASAFVRGA